MFIPLYTHQIQTADFIEKNMRVFDTSDPGTGKTRARLEGYMRSCEGRHLIVAPLTILKPSWENDIKQFTGYDCSIAHGSPIKRIQAFEANTQIVLINPDGIVWLADAIKKKTISLEKFTDLTIDEFTAFKNRTSQRSKAMGQVVLPFKRRVFMSGTPNPKSILDFWYPAFLMDGGQRLGRNFFQFRTQVCHPVQIGPQAQMVQWRDKPEAVQIVANALAEITIRHKLEECIDMPEHVMTVMEIDMPKTIMEKYHQLNKTAVLFTEDGQINALHASAKVKKLLQLLSGAVYDQDGTPLRVHLDRYELTMDLIDAREHCLVAFNWTHQRDEMVKLIEARGWTYGIIDGSVNNSTRNKYVEEFQKGELRVLLCHPQSAGHGLTLTKGTTTIWPSPTDNAEWFQQFNRRIYRSGQKKRTETICIAATGTKEQEVYKKLNEKIERMDDILNIFNQSTKQDEA
jgi:SNF2 family DNA or RNA helicase